MTRDKWMKEAKRWAYHAYCYEGMVDEFPEYFEPLCRANNDPYEAVDQFAEAYDLDRCDGLYGVHSGVSFEKNQQET